MLKLLSLVVQTKDIVKMQDYQALHEYLVFLDNVQLHSMICLCFLMVPLRSILVVSVNEFLVINQN